VPASTNAVVLTLYKEGREFGHKREFDRRATANPECNTYFYVALNIFLLKATASIIFHRLKSLAFQ
jgi:hypothetical protein